MEKKNVEEVLWDDYNTISKKLNGIDMGSNDAKILLEERDKIRNELIEIKKIDDEIDVKVSEIENDNFKEKVRNIITISTFIISTGISLYTINKTFKFDQVSTTTSTLGRSILTNFIPKFRK